MTTATMPMIIDLCAELVGKRFAWHGRGPEEYDCWGLVYACMHRMGVECPDYRSATDGKRNAATMLEAMAHGWLKLDCARPGCAVLFKMDLEEGSHVGFVVARDLFLHTTKETDGAVIERLSSPLWRGRVMGFYWWVGQ